MTGSKQLFVALAVAIVLGTASWLGLFQNLDNRVDDLFFRLRHRLELDPPVDDRIVIVELDNETFNTLGQPVSRWADDYARVVGALLDGGASVVGFDILFNPRLEKLAPEDSDKIYGEVEQLAGLVLQNNVVLIDSYRQTDGGTLGSVDMLNAAAGDSGNLGWNNLLTDPDGVVRSLGLFFFDQEPRQTRNFAGRLAELASGKRIVFFGGRVTGLWSDDGERMRINYPGPPGQQFERLQMSRILEGEKLDLKGKICLLGPAYDTSNDLHNVPFHNPAWGVEVHAAALNTILTGNFLKEAGPGAQILFTLAGAFFAFLLATRAPTQTLLLGGTALIVVYLTYTFALFCKLGWLSPIFAPVAATFLAGGLTALARYRALEASRRYVKSVLGRFVSPQVMEELLASPDNLQLGGRRKRITVLFTDINNFTPLCEKRTPEEVIIMLNEFFNEMLEIIFRHDGTVKQFVGDEIMVMYGAPHHQDDHARRAVLTARDMVARLNELKADKGEKAGFYEVKVGIHSGDVVVGNVGNEKRSEYAAVGDPVNTAARIEGLTKSLDEAILVSEETVREIGDDLDGITFVSKGHQRFKGKADQMEVFGIRWG